MTVPSLRWVAVGLLLVSAAEAAKDTVKSKQESLKKIQSEL